MSENAMKVENEWLQARKEYLKAKVKFQLLEEMVLAKEFPSGKSLLTEVYFTYEKMFHG